MDLAKLEPSFGEPKVESTPLRPFLFQVHAPDPSQLRVVVTDFLTTTFEALRSIQQLDDMGGNWCIFENWTEMAKVNKTQGRKWQLTLYSNCLLGIRCWLLILTQRDETGVGGSWSDFLEYLVSSIKFGDVKLVLEGQSKSSGARLIAQKSKGMPKISVSLRTLVGTAANEAMARLSIDMYKAYKSNHKLLHEEQEGRHQLTKVLSAEKEKSEHLQKQLDGLLYSNRHNSHKIHDKLTSDTSSAATLYDKQSDQNPSPMKAPKRVVPAHRRSKVRGVLLQDTEDE